MEKVDNYLEQHNQKEHNYHTDWEDRGVDVCIECDLIRKTGGLYEWKKEELISQKQYGLLLKTEQEVTA